MARVEHVSKRWRLALFAGLVSLLADMALAGTNSWTPIGPNGGQVVALATLTWVALLWSAAAAGRLVPRVALVLRKVPKSFGFAVPRRLLASCASVREPGRRRSWSPESPLLRYTDALRRNATGATGAT